MQLLFSREDALDKNMLSRLSTSSVLEREATGVGFYCTLKFAQPLDDMPELLARDFSFNHPAFRYGGAFHCFFLERDIVELEAVAFGGRQWPSDLALTDFAEMIDNN